MADELASLNLENRFMYGIGYPILGVIFVKIYPRDPFVIPNIILFFSSLAFFYLCLKKILKSNLFSFLGVLFLLFSTPIVEYIVVPWNSTVNVFAFSLILYICSLKNINRYLVIILAMLSAWIFASRYVDVLFVLPIVLFTIKTTSKKFEIFAGRAILFFSAIFISIIPVFILHKVQNDSFSRTPYYFHTREDGTSDQDIGRYDLQKVPESLFTLTFGQRNEEDREFPPLIKTAPLIILLPVTLIVIVLKRDYKLILLAVSMGVAFTFYASFVAFDGFHLKYGCIHYIKMWFLPITLINLAGLKYLFEKHYKKP
jgi:hypothetical protein